LIRQFHSEDAPACLALIQDAILSDPSLSATARDALLEGETLETVIERSRLFYVAVYEIDGEIAGLAGLDMNEVRLLFVAPRRQREGIGGALLAHLEEMVPPALFREIFVYAAPAAAGFYRRAGYVDRGRQPFEVQEQVLETVFMVKTLA